MPKNDSGDKKYYRVLNILNRLNSGPVRVAELCAEFNISERSVQRDIERINLTGFGLDNPAKGVYTFAPGVSLKNFDLSGEQLSVLVLMREMAAGLGGPILEAFDKVFARATRAAGVDSPFFAIGSRALNPLERRRYEDIVFAIERCKKLRMTYASGSGERERVVRPVKLLTSEAFFYLLASPDEPGPLRFIKYRTDRIRKLAVLPDEFEPPAKETVRKLIGTATTIWGVNEGSPEDIELKASGAAADFLLNKEILPRQKVSRPGPDGSVRVKARIRHRMEAIPLILHWLPEITVVSPDGLKKDVEARIRAYLAAGGKP